MDMVRHDTPGIQIVPIAGSMQDCILHDLSGGWIFEIERSIPGSVEKLIGFCKDQLPVSKRAVTR